MVATVAPENSIAVITFANITREPSDEWIGSGIAETVSNDLKNVRGLTVIGRERVFDALRNLDPGEEQSQDERFGIEIVVLRLLEGEVVFESPVTYLAEIVRGDAGPWLQTWTGTLRDDLVARLATVPRVRAVAYTDQLPMNSRQQVVPLRTNAQQGSTAPPPPPPVGGGTLPRVDGGDR